MLSHIIIVLFTLALIPRDVICGVILKPYSNESHTIDDDIKFYLYTSKNPKIPYFLKPDNTTNLADSPLNPAKTTVFYIHGFSEGATSHSSQTIKEAYIENGDFNIILVCWRAFATIPWYLNAIRHVPVVGQYVAHLIKWLEYKETISLPQIHVIGFSLGAHVAAFTGEELARNRSEKIGRITGLDPAGPAWDKLSITSNGLDKIDATFVDIIHTNTETFGINIPIGHADFYVNYGKSQPGCGVLAIGCSHSRAWLYYSESLSNPFGFPSLICTTWNPTVTNCTQDSDVFMGFAISRKTKGIFFVETNSEFPYTKRFIPFIQSSTYREKQYDDNDQANCTRYMNEVIYDENCTNSNLYIESEPYSVDSINNNADVNEKILKEGYYVYSSSQTKSSRET